MSLTPKSLLFLLCMFLSFEGVGQSSSHMNSNLGTPKRTDVTQQLPGWQLVENWNTTTMSWDSAYYTTYQYNVNGQVTEINERTILGFGTLSQTRSEFQYDSNGRQVEGTSFTFTNNTWMPIYKGTCAYDAFGSKIAQTNFSYNSSNWDTTFSLFHGFAYRPNNQVLLDTTYIWVGSGMGYAPSTVQVHVYNTSDEISTSTVLAYNNGSWDTTEVSEFVWDDFSQDMYSSLELYSYANGQLDSREKEEYDRSVPNTTQVTYSEWENGAYLPVDRETSKVDNQGNLSLDRYEEYVSNSWELGGQDTFLNAYLSTDQLIEVIGQELSLSSNTYENYVRETYGNFSVSIDALAPSPEFAAIFPNPSQGKLQVQLDLQKPTKVTFGVCDLQGRTIAERHLHHPGGTAILDLSLDLPAGTYCYWVKAGPKQSQGKLVRY